MHPRPLSNPIPIFTAWGSSLPTLPLFFAFPPSFPAWGTSLPPLPGVLPPSLPPFHRFMFPYSLGVIFLFFAPSLNHVCRLVLHHATSPSSIAGPLLCSRKFPPTVPQFPYSVAIERLLTCTLNSSESSSLYPEGVSVSRVFSLTFSELLTMAFPTPLSAGSRPWCCHLLVSLLLRRRR
jgi:hypothetical protein